MEAQNSVDDETNSNITDNNGMYFKDEKHSSALQIGLSSLLYCSLYSDVTLEAEGISIPAHKNVLAAVSNYFRLIFSHEFKESITGVVNLPNISPTILKTVLTYIYTGNVTISDDSVKDILQAAHLMELPFLVESCQLFLKSKLSLKNAVTTLQISKLYGLEDTTTSSIKYIDEIPDSEICKLTSSELIEIVNDDKLRVRREDDFLNVILNWLEYTKEENYDVAFQLMRAVRLSKLSHDFVNELMLKEKFQNRLCCSFIENILSPWTVSHRGRPGSYNLFIIGIESDRRKLICIELDTVSGNNSKLDSIPELPFRYSSCVFVKNKLYAFNKSGPVCFDPVEHSWIFCCSMTYKRRFPVVVELDGFIYACGGGLNDNIKTVERYDPETDQWTEVASMIDPRNWAFGAVLNGRIYVMGGYDESGCISTCEYYDSELNSWQSFTSLPEPFGYASAVAYQDALYVTGGENSYGNPTDSFYKYDIHTKRWSYFSKMPFKTAGHVSYADDGKIYVVAKTEKFELGIFDIDSGQWQVKKIKDLDDVDFFIHCSKMSGFPF